MPGYGFILDGDMVEMHTKLGAPPYLIGKPGAQAAAARGKLCAARELAPGWDVRAIEAEWRGWVERNASFRANPTPTSSPSVSAAANIPAFSKKRIRMAETAARAWSACTRGPTTDRDAVTAQRYLLDS